MTADGWLLRAVPWIKPIEGGYSNRKADRGGPTGHGITIPTLHEAIALGIVPAGTTVQGLTWDQALAILKALYWDRCRCTDLPPGIDLAVYDGAVNSGVAQSSRWLQRAVLDAAGVAIADDGVIGWRTLVAVRTAANMGRAAQLLGSLLLQRRAFLDDFIEREPDQEANRKGWANRLADLETQCRALVGGTTEPAR
jgi:lysozyme family protein